MKGLIMSKQTPLEQMQTLWHELNRAGRDAHLQWTMKHCATCGRPGAVNGLWCDACCEEGQADCSRA